MVNLERRIPIFESKGQDNGFFSYKFPLESGLVLHVAGGTKKGRVRQHNEPNQDNYLAAGRVIAVADGLSNPKRGDVASRIVTDCLAMYSLGNSPLIVSRRLDLFQYLRAHPEIDNQKVDSIVSDMNLLIAGIEQGYNMRDVCIGSSGSARSMFQKLGPMDTTIAVGEFRDNRFYWYHQGDSSIFYYNDNEAPLDKRNMLTRPDWGMYYGREDWGALEFTIVAPDENREIKSMPIKAGDNFIIFSDGLDNQTANTLLPIIPSIYKEVEHISSASPVIHAAYQLIEKGWYGDDITLILARVEKA